MKSIRLNVSIRETILDNISKKYAENNPMPELTINLKGMLEKAVRTYYMERSLEIRKIIEANPEIDKCMAYTTFIEYRNPEGYWKRTYTKDEEQRFIANFAHTICFDNDDQVKKYAVLRKAKDAYLKAKKAARKEREAQSTWRTEHDKYMEEVRQVVYGVNTTKQLLEVWPEIAEFMPQGYQDPSKIALPAVSIANLNGKLKGKK